MSLSELRIGYERRVGQRDQIRKQIVDASAELKKRKREKRIAETAQEFVRAVALETQAQLEFRISSTVSAAQEAVFDDAYGFVVKFEERRGKTECDLFFERGEQLLDPLASAGYGAVDVASFALRIGCWSMSRRTRPVLLLDEPFRHLKGAVQNVRALHMIREISRELNVQIIMVSDERAEREDIVAASDAVFEIAMSTKGSVVNALERA